MKLRGEERERENENVGVGYLSEWFVVAKCYGFREIPNTTNIMIAALRYTIEQKVFTYSKTSRLVYIYVK